MKEKNVKLVASFSLVLLAAIWGFSYVGTEIAINKGWGSFATLFVRALSAGIVILLATLKKSYNNKGLIKSGIILGVLTFFAYGSVLLGQRYTTISSTSFLASLYIVFIPIINMIFLKKKESFIVIICCVVAVIGCLFINLELPFTFNKENLLGNLLVILSALFYAIQMIFISKYAKEYDILQLTTINLFTMALLGLIAMSILDEFKTMKVDGLFDVLWVGLISTGFGSVLQVFGQKKLSTTFSGILLGLESLFGLAFAVFVNNEILNVFQIIGSILIFASTMCSCLHFKKKHKETS